MAFVSSVGRGMIFVGGVGVCIWQRCCVLQRWPDEEMSLNVELSGGINLIVVHWCWW
jgi:hypothetical protein